MKRINPLGSLPGIILTALLFLGLGFSLWYNRGLAFSPGPVTEIYKEGEILQGFTSHAEFEKQCSYCHEPLKTDLSTKCKTCHEGVKEQIQSGEGVHSQIAEVNMCGACHADHKGREFNPTQASYKMFDHSSTRFSLIWHQTNFDATPMECAACHKNTQYANIDYRSCTGCHEAVDINFAQRHTEAYGSQCLDCHDGLDRMKAFDHGQTGFILESKHAQINCTDCHNNKLADTPKECKDCHLEPSLHQGLFQQTCDDCHTSASWSPTLRENQSFSHLETAGFSLELHKVDYHNQDLTCYACHPADLQIFDLQTCVNCHNQPDTEFIAQHQEQFGSDCLVCHDGVDRLHDFDHSDFFQLDGKHLSIPCSNCHANKIFRGTPKECWQCHKEPEIHASVFGLKCFYCHNSETWSPASLYQHVFPLNHGFEEQSLQLECDSCHGINFFEYTCYNCHDHKPERITQSHIAEGIAVQELPACANCHPTGNKSLTGANP